MTNLIGISGDRDGVGKDSVATAIQGLTLGFNKETIVTRIKENRGFGSTPKIGYERKSFSEPIKQILCILTGCTIEQLEDREFKESIMPKEWWVTIQDYWGFTPYQTPKNPSIHPYNEELVNKGFTYYRHFKPTYRWAMRHIGSELFRDRFHPETWINARFSTFKETSHWIIPDVRFPNEMSKIREKKGIVLRVINSKKDNKKATHQSENSLDNDIKKWKYDFIIDNCGSIEELVDVVEKMCFKLGIIKNY